MSDPVSASTDTQSGPTHVPLAIGATGPVFDNSIQAIKAYFESDLDATPQKIELPEFKNLTGDERKELGLACALRLGGTIK